MLNKSKQISVCINKAVWSGRENVGNFIDVPFNEYKKKQYQIIYTVKITLRSNKTEILE